jgi:hypothetical protein
VEPKSKAPHNREKYIVLHQQWKADRGSDLEHNYDTMGRNLADIQREGQRQVVLFNSRNRWKNLERMLQNMTKSRYLETKRPRLLIEQARLYRFWGVIGGGRANLLWPERHPWGPPPPSHTHHPTIQPDTARCDRRAGRKGRKGERERRREKRTEGEKEMV